MDDNDDLRTLWCGNLSPQATDEILFELFHQAGPVEKVRIPKDKEGKIRNYGFILFKHQVSVPYAMEIMEGTTIFGRPLVLKYRQGREQQQQQQRLTDQYQRQQHSSHQRSYSMPEPAAAMQGASQSLLQQGMIPPMNVLQGLNSFNTLHQSLLTLQGIQQFQFQQQMVNMVPQQQQFYHLQQQQQGPENSPSQTERERQNRHVQERNSNSKFDRDRSHSRSQDRHYSRSNDRWHDRQNHRRRR